MFKPPKNKSRSVLGVTDLTVAASIRSGLIPAVDSRTYETRLQLLLGTLSAVRTSSKEVRPLKLLDDAVDRIRAIQSFRLAIVGEPMKRQLVLAVSFDGGWEPYMRRIWRDLGPLLDVIFCNCEGYPISRECSYADYVAWVRSAQVQTEFFYNAVPLTVSDLHYFRKTPPLPAPPAAPQALLDEALPGLVALYRLTDMYPPRSVAATSGDGDILLRATQYLFEDRFNELKRINAAALGRTKTESAALHWLQSFQPPKPGAMAPGTYVPSKVQGGIVDGYGQLTHGCLVLVQLRDAAAARALLDWACGHVSNGATQCPTGIPYINLALTFQGLQIAGVPNGALDQMPFEFREGMEARASILGDHDHNHPSRWRRPRRNWLANASRDKVELSSVHAVVQFWVLAPGQTRWQPRVSDPGHPLHGAVTALDAAVGSSGVTILSVQAMQRENVGTPPLGQGHFGYVDGVSQPVLQVPSPAPVYANKVELGDILLGYDNSFGDKATVGRLWNDSSFLVVRKLRQDVEAFDAMCTGLVSGTPPLSSNGVKALLMGRTLKGDNLVTLNTGNNFTYGGRPGGSCPFQSHVRRANPRETRQDQKIVPRIVRRGMSYGPTPAARPKARDRGLMFMAYNASIAEQFEVIQAWLSGGNSSGRDTYSAERDPFLGVAMPGDPHIFQVKPGTRWQLKPTRPLVTLEWGLYAFAPSMKALVELRDLAEEAVHAASLSGKSEQAELRQRERCVLAQKGEAMIRKLRQVEELMGAEAAKQQWKIALEDMGARVSGVSEAIWAAVREVHGGVLKTPFGVLVGSSVRVEEVLSQSRYSATGYAERMKASFGEIYLGMDKGPRYWSESSKVNAAIQRVTEADGFTVAFGCMTRAVQGLLGAAPRTVELKELIDEALAEMSEHWFGVPDRAQVLAGGWYPDQTPKATCPGYFHAPSRYMFQPHPGREAEAMGCSHGRSLRPSAEALLGSAALAAVQGSAIGGAVLLGVPAGKEPGAAPTLIGVMMGMLPTIDGNFRSVMYEWTQDRSLWEQQLAWRAGTAPGPQRAANVLRTPLLRTMQLRPVPELVWRTALEDHEMGGVQVRAGERMVVGLVSASQEKLFDDEVDVSMVFGGNRAGSAHPLHACPGQSMAIGILLGMLAALLETAELRPALSPTAIVLSRR